MSGNKFKNRKVVYLRPKNRAIKPTFIATLFLCLAIVIFLLISFFKNDIYIVEEGDLYESFTSTAVVIRQEELVKSPTDGNLEVFVEPNERVRVKTPLFKVISDRKKQEEYIKQINEVKSKLERIKNDQDQHGQSILDKSIKNMTVKLQDAIAKGDIDNANNIKSELERLKVEKNKKHKIKEENIKTMQESLKNLTDKVQEVEYTVYAPMSGIVSFNIDGLEELLSPSNIQDITYNDIIEICNKTKDTIKENTLKSVTCNMPVLKIIDNYCYYIAVPLDKKLHQGQVYDLIFAGCDKPVKGKLEHIAGNSKYVGIFCVNSDIKELLATRNLEVKILLGKFYGKIVPKDCLVNLEGKEGVYIIQRNKRIFKPVKIIAKNDHYAAVEGLKIGDKILIK